MKELKKYMKHSSLNICLLFLLAFISCKKEKQNFEYDNRPVQDTRANSMVRIVNLAGFNQVVANWDSVTHKGDTLTNYVVRAVNDPLEGRYPATVYFPSDGRLGATWTIPQSLLKNGSLKLMTEDRNINGSIAKTQLEVTQNVQEAADYYLLSTVLTTGQPASVRVPRSVSSAVDPSKFKIRILNLAATVRPDQGVENLVGPVSLSWADGTPVSAATSNILPGKYSEYIDLPYGTDQFKILTAAGIQVPGINSEIMQAETSTLLNSSNLTYAPVKTYVPGGVYTIVIAAQNFSIPYKNGGVGETVSGYQNSFTVISDVADPVNLTYSRLQAANALPGMDGIKVLVNGNVLGNALPYTASTDYAAFIRGNYKIDAVDATGAVIASAQLQLDANTNFTLWVHPDAAGKPKLSAVANDLSGGFYYSGGDDASTAGARDAFPFNIRFLNLCPDIPYLTMTTNNGQAFNSFYTINPDAMNNLKPGIFPIEDPYVRLRMESGPYQIMAFRSAPNIIPGTWASDIPVLTGTDLIARPALYVRGNLPNQEPGIYTIALIGSTNASAPAAQRAKLMILKHNK